MKNIRSLLIILLISKSLFAAQQQLNFQLPEQNALPSDISFCIADLKLDGSNIQICEFGEGLESRFKGYDAITHQGAMWEALWQALGAYKHPVWVIENDFWKQHTADYAYRALQINGGSMVSSFGQAQQKMYANKTKAAGAKSEGIVLLHGVKKSAVFVKNTAKQYPNLLFLSKATARFVSSKQETNALFNTPFLQQFKPQNLLIKKQYYAGLASDILKNIPNEYLVIKPTNSSLGHGIIIIHRRQLDETIKLILQGHTEPLAKYQANRNYSYWLKDKDSHFIIEAFAQSKPLIVNNNAYDPTMRIAFVMSNLKGKMQISYLGSYWKLPAKHLNEPGDFTEKHKSATTSHPWSSVLVADEDYFIVCQQLNELLPILYAKMLDLTSA